MHPARMSRPLMWLGLRGARSRAVEFLPSQRTGCLECRRGGLHRRREFIPLPEMDETSGLPGLRV